MPKTPPPDPLREAAESVIRAHRARRVGRRVSLEPAMDQLREALQAADGVRIELTVEEAETLLRRVEGTIHRPATYTEHINAVIAKLRAALSEKGKTHE